jgi:hypothetical protein
MTKEKEEEYTSPEGRLEEAYGQITLAMSTHFLSDEGKALKYLTNELFLAAKADLREDKKRESQEKVQMKIEVLQTLIFSLRD